jgi:hypothetical protein
MVTNKEAIRVCVAYLWELGEYLMGYWASKLWAKIEILGV